MDDPDVQRYMAADETLRAMNATSESGSRTQRSEQHFRRRPRQESILRHTV